MLRNPSYPGHSHASSVTPGARFPAKRVKDCRRCGHAFVWVESERTGKVYMASVYAKQSEEYGTNPDVLRYYPFSPHNCRPEDVAEHEAIHGATV